MSLHRDHRCGVALFMAAGLFASVLGQATPAVSQVPQARAAGPALWVIRDADSTVYLFGTTHLLRAATVWETPEIMAAFDSAEELWLEVEDSGEGSPSALLIAEHGLSSGRPLSRLLSPAERNAVSAAADRAGLTAAQLEGFRPWLAGMVVGNSPMLEAGYDPAFGVEVRLRERAAASGKTVRGFETPESQVRYLAALPEETQLDFLRFMIRPPELVLSELDASVAAWTTGDMEGLEHAAILPTRRGSEALYQALMARRSRLLADHLKTVLDGSGIAFVALGAGYLVGDDSVQSVLATRGVTVTRE